MSEFPEIFLRQVFSLDNLFVHSEQKIYAINLTDF